jgi:hypothetical protein
MPSSGDWDRPRSYREHFTSHKGPPESGTHDWAGLSYVSMAVMHGVDIESWISQRLSQVKKSSVQTRSVEDEYKQIIERS